MSHRCLWPGCECVVPDSMWGCRPHWYRLPNDIRSWIGRSYRAGLDAGCHPTRRYIRAHRAALAFAATQTTETDRHESVQTVLEYR
jgi:hypothetical protein